MSCVPDADDGSCANCGKHGDDTVKLKDCTACRLVKYCGVDCQKAHRKQHKKACKKRSRAQGRGTVQSGAGEAGVGLLPDLHTADAVTDARLFRFQLLLHEIDLQWL